VVGTVGDIIAEALDGPVFGLSQPEREAKLLPVIRALTAHSQRNTQNYQRPPALNIIRR